jgi:hypothetical protein
VNTITSILIVVVIVVIIIIIIIIIIIMVRKFVSAEPDCTDRKSVV